MASLETRPDAAIFIIIYRHSSSFLIIFRPERVGRGLFASHDFRRATPSYSLVQERGLFKKQYPIMGILSMGLGGDNILVLTRSRREETVIRFRFPDLENRWELTMSRTEKNQLAGIEYSGIAGSSEECKDTVIRLLQYRDQITRARILSCSNNHCLLLTVNVGDLIAVKSGFTSGYGGGGPSAFSYVLQLLDAHGAEIEEYEVDGDVIERLDKSSLTETDVRKLDTAHPIRPARWYDYVFEKDHEKKDNGTLWQEFRPVIPLGVIDSRIIDLALSFWQDPDDKLLKGYRRLEDIVRKRTDIDEHGTKLFSQAFGAENPMLGWTDISSSEQRGRCQLFTAAFMAYRNPRAHRELNDYACDHLTEFLLLNHLYLLEKKSCKDHNGKMS